MAKTLLALDAVVLALETVVVFEQEGVLLLEQQLTDRADY